MKYLITVCLLILWNSTVSAQRINPPKQSPDLEISSGAGLVTEIPTYSEVSISNLWSIPIKVQLRCYEGEWEKGKQHGRGKFRKKKFAREGRWEKGERKKWIG